MITTEIINELYKRYNKQPKSIDCLNLALLFDRAGIMHDILIDPETEEMTIGSIEPESPFHTIKLGNVNAIVPFEEWVAIVMHSSVLFLNTREPKVAVHLKQPAITFWDRIRKVC